MYDHVNEEGYRIRLLDSIERHRSDENAVRAPDGYTKDSRGRKSRKITTKGWDLLVKWRDSSKSWLPLHDLKESNPLDVAEYALAKKISKEPAFTWWVPYVLRERDAIISLVKTRLKK